MTILIPIAVALVLGAGLIAAITGLDRYTGFKEPTSGSRPDKSPLPPAQPLGNADPGGSTGLAPTDELFIDPVTRETIRVYVEAATGKRVYKKADKETSPPPPLP